jgi:hypothetical protein
MKDSPTPLPAKTKVALGRKDSTEAADLAQSVRASPNKAVDPAAETAAGHCRRSTACAGTDARRVLC